MSQQPIRWLVSSGKLTGVRDAGAVSYTQLHLPAAVEEALDQQLEALVQSYSDAFDKLLEEHGSVIILLARVNPSTTMLVEYNS